MNFPATRILSLIPAFVLCFGSSGCREESQDNTAAKSEPQRYTHRKELETGEDGLVRRQGETEPYTGVVIHGDGERTISYFASYRDGKAHGPQIHYHDNGRIRLILDFEDGEKVRHREWFENGNREMDAMMRDGIAYGRHLRWFEDGSLRFRANFLEKLRWDGQVKDVAPDGTVMWDAWFENGKYRSGHYPEEAQENLLERGLITPEEAKYPIKEATTEGGAGGEKAGEN